ncbi:hypothetical protein M9458_052449, partial [Cirrhinus mrigala]
ELKCPATGVSTEDGEPPAASWKWYSAMDEAIGSRPSITPPALVASSGPDVAVASSSSVMAAPVSKKRKGDLTDLMREMEEREAKRKEDGEKWRRRKTGVNERDRRERRDEKEKQEKEKSDGSRKQ